MTLIYQRTTGGRMNRCDARCHNAKRAKCKCICGGRYHGKRSNSVELLEAVRETASTVISDLETNGVDCDGLRALLLSGVQLRLVETQ